jgi:hypothetical protein
MTETRKLRVFLCHSSQDKPIVRELCQRLNAEGWIDPWLDEEKLLPGQDWDMEIEKAVEAADTVIACLSKNSVSREGYIQRELKFVLDIALEKPEGSIFIIPVRLDECDSPRRLRSWQYVDYFPLDRKNWAYSRLLSSLKIRHDLKVGDEYFEFSNLVEIKQLRKGTQDTETGSHGLNRIIDFLKWRNCDHSCCNWVDVSILHAHFRFDCWFCFCT